MVTKRVESLDTNIILRILLEDIPEQYEKVMALMERPNVVYYISDFAILEVVFFLTWFDIDRETIVGAILRVLSRPNIKSSRTDFVEVAMMYLEHPKLSFADCYLALEAARNKAEPLWTFDRKLAQQSPTAKELA